MSAAAVYPKLRKPLLSSTHVVCKYHLEKGEGWRERCIQDSITALNHLLPILSPNTLLARPFFPPPLPPIILPPNLQILLQPSFLLDHEPPQPLILRLQLPNTLFQPERLVLQILSRLLEGLFALLLLDAEAGRGGGVAAAFVFLGREAGSRGLGLGGVVEIIGVGGCCWGLG